MPLYSESWPDGSHLPKGKTEPALKRQDWRATGFSLEGDGIIEYTRNFIHGGISGVVNYGRDKRWRWWVKDDLGQDQSAYLAKSHKEASLSCEEFVRNILLMAEKELAHNNTELPPFWIQVTERQYLRRYVNASCYGLIYTDDSNLWGWGIGYSGRRCASSPDYDSEPFHLTAKDAAAECDQRIRALVRKALVELTPKSQK